MLRGNKVGLRARIEADVPVLHAELYDDVVMRSRVDRHPWRPISPGSPASPYAITDPSDNVFVFSIVELVDEEPVVGDAVLWGVDTHNRSAHIGIGLRPAFRGRGLGEDAVRLLCEYAFVVRGLHRVGLETLTDNVPMIRVAERVGFVREGTLRQPGWVNGEFLDEAIYGMLAREWRDSVSSRPQGDEKDAAEALSWIDDIVDEAGRESFPASDPPAF